VCGGRHEGGSSDSRNGKVGGNGRQERQKTRGGELKLTGVRAGTEKRNTGSVLESTDAGKEKNLHKMRGTILKEEGKPNE